MSAPIVERSTTPLSQLLREGTMAAHQDAEESDFMAQLLDGHLNTRAAHLLTGQLGFVYEALEDAMRAVADSPAVATIYDPNLERVPALRSDLENMLGAEWESHVEMLPATARYVARLRELADQGDALRLIAHDYVRYLGDISGGQVIRKRLNGLYGISMDHLLFYDFAAIGKIPPYRTNYRKNLDALPLDHDSQQVLVEEAKKAFAFNSAVFAELEASLSTK